MARARLVRGANGAAHHNRALIANQTQELREPGHVPTPPRPQTGFARGQSSPKDWPHPFCDDVSPLALLRRIAVRIQVRFGRSCCRAISSIGRAVYGPNLTLAAVTSGSA